MSGPEAGTLLALGLDAGGTATRWALVAPPGQVVAEGEGAGFSALECQGLGRPRVAPVLKALAEAVAAQGRPVALHAGLTGLDGATPELIAFFAEAFGVPPGAVSLGSDIETVYRSAFAPGEGYVVYAGTGSVAAFIDAQGTLHRAGGRGVVLDDGGGGHWIAREALRQVWRAEDERPGAWRESPLAQALFAQLGGSEWALTRQVVYGGQRGDVGRLALAVAKAADRDAAARAILVQAGEELARLARAMTGRFGPRPVALSGRAPTLHPAIVQSFRAGLPEGTPFSFRPTKGHHAAALLALAYATGAAPRPTPLGEP